MTPLPKRLYGDPLEVLIRAEEETCKGCRWRCVDQAFDIAVCANLRSGALKADKRCDEYEESQ